MKKKWALTVQKTLKSMFAIIMILLVSQYVSAFSEGGTTLTVNNGTQSVIDQYQVMYSQLDSIFQTAVCTDRAQNNIELIETDLMPESSVRYYAPEEFLYFTPQQLCYARNEIFAKHGRKFASQELTDYFGSKSWYKPVYEPDAFSMTLLNVYEVENIRLLKEREDAICPGGYLLDQPGYETTFASVTEIYSDMDIAEMLYEQRYGYLFEIDESTRADKEIQAKYYKFFDMDQDGQEELLLYAENTQSGEACWNWKLYDGKNGVVSFRLQNWRIPIESPHGAITLFGDTSFCDEVNGIANGNDIVYKSYVYTQNGELRNLEYYSETAASTGTPEQAVRISYHLNGNEINAETFSENLISLYQENAENLITETSLNENRIF